MSICISLTTTTDKIASFRKLLDTVARKHAFTTAHDDEGSTLTVCRMGELRFDYTKNSRSLWKRLFSDRKQDRIRVEGDCSTNLLGPGFHKAAAELLDEIVAANGFPAEIFDETDYCEHRDFERLRAAHCSWLQNVIEMSTGERLAICLDINKYLPEDIPSTEKLVATPLGRFRLNEWKERIKKGGIASIAKEFFIWNDEEQDAAFHLKMGLNALWEDCYFMPSSRSDEDEQINALILDELEKAARMDPTLPFPVAEYSEVCRLAERNPIDLSALSPLKSEFPIGYRKGKVSLYLGNLAFKLPGHFLFFSEPKKDRIAQGFYDRAEGSGRHILRMFALTTDKTALPEDDKQPIAEKSFDSGCYQLYDCTGDEATDEYVFQCCILTPGQFSVFTLSCGDREEARRFMTEFASGLSVPND